MFVVLFSAWLRASPLNVAPYWDRPAAHTIRVWLVPRSEAVRAGGNALDQGGQGETLS